MKVYSKTIELFLQKLQGLAKEIIANEFDKRVARTRFHLPNGYSYPITIVAIDEPNRLGYFNFEDLTIGINRSLMYQAKSSVIKDILRHELAHYFTYIEFEHIYKTLLPHGAEFQSICRKYNLSQNISSATCDLKTENEKIEGDLKSEKIINKIHKLLSLASSDNPHEAELATLKANQLMVQHNLESIQLFKENASLEQEYYVNMILPCKRWTPRLSAISKILSEFFVYPVKTREGLEVTGTKANIENAEYVANYLDKELKKVWNTQKKLNSRIKPKPFFIALANSYCQKIHNSKSHMPKANQKALMIIKQELDWAVNGVYNRLTCSRSSYTNCTKSSALGHLAGMKLNINRGISPKGFTRLLS